MLTVGFCTRKSDKSYIEHIKNTCSVKDVEIIELTEKTALIERIEKTEQKYRLSKEKLN
jgi:hypothetical protein